MTRERKDARERGWSLGGFAAAAIGLALTGIGVFFLLSFATADVRLDPALAAKDCWTGLLGAWMAFGGVHTFGQIPAVVMAVLLTLWGLHVIGRMTFFATWPLVFGGVLIILAVAIGSCALADKYDMASGGLLAVYVSPPAILYFGRWGLVLAAAAILVLGILLAFGESAVFGVHKLAFFIYDMIRGFFSMFGRLGELLRLLVRPSLAAAGGVAAARPAPAAPREKRAAKPAERKQASMEKEEKAESGEPDKREQPEAAKPEAPVEKPDDKPANSEESSVEVELNDGVQPPPRKEPLKEWKPWESFNSNFFSLDLRDDSATARSEPVQAVVAPPPAAPEPSEPINIIMEVETEDDAGEIADTLEELVEESAGARAEEPPAQEKRLEDSESSVAETEIEQMLEFETREVDDAEEDAEAEENAFKPAMPKLDPRPRPAEKEPVKASGGSEKRERPAAPATDWGKYELPSLELLDPPEPPVVEDRTQIEMRARILEQTLGEFKIEGRVVHIERGPRVTQYELLLAPGIRLSKVTSLADNLAMQLKAEAVRIIAPIPGKNTIGIEIPNTAKELVSLREIVGAVNREKRRQALPICLGKDVAGQPLVADLARMPHLLIAGATGSGKSVCINSIILSVMMCCKPDEAQMIMVDPKVVELSRFKDIPHLMSPVITDMKRAVSVLEWICQKMDERYEQMSQVSVNNIAKFNALGDEGIRQRLDEFASLEDIEAFPKSMPYMVVIIDELADLMMVAGKEVEQHITRLAAKSRAVGIHLILATQRPSVDVITGLIKANMPCRIAFQVASRVDSRTILDQNGAETLLGQGDMLYLPPGVGKLTRAQGVFVSDEELFRVVDITKSMAQPQYHADLLGPVIGGGGGAVDVSSFDELFVQSGEAIIESQRGSVSLLQRKFGIGYGRAARIIDQLASVGLLGPFRDGKAREILMTMDEFDAKFAGGGKASSWDDDDDDGSLAGLRDDEREPVSSPWDDDEGVA